MTTTRRSSTLADLIDALMSFYSREYGDKELARLATATTINELLLGRDDERDAAAA